MGRRHAGLLARSLIVVAVIRTALTLTSYRAVSRHILLRHTAQQRRSVPVIVWGVKHASRIIPKAHCLTRALAVQYMLARQGDVSTVRVGVAQDAQGRVEAHAWALYDDQVLIGGFEEDIGRFTPIADLRPIG
ncbi:lasso peptide biosynthesis B2 protein [Croceicoccus sp. F390]|uniref:Lasso peptide biosynthesis B2 protein n=1 Tax=Croceicoccus esteveae TaxID=3075597 RepID=A0ABU2ZKA1_9SPHN|nr:lasso peptide biosynthesis B2 protein [Croceicoccus sp. F390]MDT0577030.1 lasso peptide biosynthesis B2 protein [Croceicoccus sp. F390]